MLLNNAQLNYSLPEGQVLVCTARCDGTEGAKTGEGVQRRSGTVSTFQVRESSTFQYEEDESV